MSLGLRQGDRHGPGGLHVQAARGGHCMAPAPGCRRPGAGGVDGQPQDRANATARQPGRENNTATGENLTPSHHRPRAALHMAAVAGGDTWHHTRSSCHHVACRELTQYPCQLLLNRAGGKDGETGHCSTAPGS